MTYTHTGYIGRNTWMWINCMRYSKALLSAPQFILSLFVLHLTRRFEFQQFSQDQSILSLILRMETRITMLRIGLFGCNEKYKYLMKKNGNRDVIMQDPKIRHKISSFFFGKGRERSSCQLLFLSVIQNFVCGFPRGFN